MRQMLRIGDAIDQDEPAQPAWRLALQGHRHQQRNAPTHRMADHGQAIQIQRLNHTKDGRRLVVEGIATAAGLL